MLGVNVNWVIYDNQLAKHHRLELFDFILLDEFSFVKCDEIVWGIQRAIEPHVDA